MPVIYEVTITPAEIENHYTITWFNPNTNIRDSFDSRAELTPEETGRLWQWQQGQLSIGRKLCQARKKAPGKEKSQTLNRNHGFQIQSFPGFRANCKNCIIIW